MNYIKLYEAYHNCLTGKTGYDGKKSALTAINSINKKRMISGGKKIADAYPCSYCNNWHLTSKSKEEMEEIRNDSDILNKRGIILMKKFQDFIDKQDAENADIKNTNNIPFTNK